MQNELNQLMMKLEKSIMNENFIVVTYDVSLASHFSLYMNKY